VNLFSNGDNIEIGSPILEKVFVEATIMKQFNGDTDIAFKMKAKKRYRRKIGSRPFLTLLHPDKIGSE
jgi:ribosomal protein L21